MSGLQQTPTEPVNERPTSAESDLLRIISVGRATDATPSVARRRNDAEPISGDLQRILAAPRLVLGQWPTPIETVDAGESTILVKRDDLSGFGRGGAKTRKIEHVLGFLRARGHDELITVIGNITNLGFDLVPALRAHGFSSRIFVQNDPPMPHQTRLSFLRGLENEVQLLGSGRVMSAMCVGFEWIRRSAAGRKPFLLLPGASHPAGVLGNASGFIEMVRQLHATGRPLPSRLYVAVATGTTLAGFLLAENALRRAGCAPIRIIGVQVYPGAVERRTRLMLRWTEKHLGLEHGVDPTRIFIRTDALQGGFGRSDAALEEICCRVRAQSGLQLDPIFGGKTWRVMERDQAAGEKNDGPMMYWHCGYTPDWETLVKAVRGNSFPPSPVTGTDTGEAVRPASNGHSCSDVLDTHVFAGKSKIVSWRKLAIVGSYLAVFYGALPLFLWTFGGRLDAVFTLPPLQGAAVAGLGTMLLVIGMTLVVLSTLSFLRVGKGLPISHLPPTRLVSLGSYRWTRHPHYVGYNLVFIGGGVLAESWGRSVGAGGLLLSLWLLYTLVFEEPKLERRFGRNYIAYRQCVRILPVPSSTRLFRTMISAFRRPLERLANRLVLFRTGAAIWVTYGLFAALGAGAMGLGFAWFLIGLGVSGFTTWWSVALVAGIITVASRTAWLVLPGDTPRGSWREMVRKVGFVSWGGYAAALVTAIGLGVIHGISAWRMLDIAMITGLFASSISRWGCFTYGCCIGQETSWGLRWVDPESWIQRVRPGRVVPRIPTQILSSLHAGIAGVALLALTVHPTAPGALMALGGLLYTLPRFGVEHLREEARYGGWQLTSGQFGCGVMFLSCVVLFYLIAGDPIPLWPQAAPVGNWPSLLASAATAFAIVFVAYGVHWKRIGRW